MREPTTSRHDHRESKVIPWPDPVTEDDVDRAAEALAHNLNRLLANLPSNDVSYTMSAAHEAGKATKRSFTGYFCWTCGKHVWADQPWHRGLINASRVFHSDPNDCD